MNIEKRIGRFTSSEIHRLMTGVTGPDKKARTYIEEKAMEIVAGLSVKEQSDAKPLVWGRLCEDWAFGEPDVFGLDYNTDSQDTLVDDVLPWAGSPDGFRMVSGKREAVFDLKCPFSRKSYLTFFFCKDIQDVRDTHQDGEKYYWQLVSNAALSGVNKAELIVFCPTEAQLEAIQLKARESGDGSAYGIGFDPIDKLAHVKDGFPNIIKFAFDVPEADIDRLTTRVEQCAFLLQERVEAMRSHLSWLKGEKDG